jgi:hypothetical protein
MPNICDSKDYKQFGKANGVELRDLVCSYIDQIKTLIEGKIDVLHTLIEGNDKRYQEKFMSQDQAVHEAFNSAQIAIAKSEVGAEKRSDAVYVTISELQKTLSSVVSRSEYDSSQKNLSDKIDIQIKAIVDKIDALNITTISRQGLDLGKKEGMGTMIAIVTVVAAVVSLAIKFLFH